MKPTFTPLPKDQQFDVVVTRALPKSHFGKVIGTYPGGALRVEVLEDQNGRKQIVKLLPKSCIRLSK